MGKHFSKDDLESMNERKKKPTMSEVAARRAAVMDGIHPTAAMLEDACIEQGSTIGLAYTSIVERLLGFRHIMGPINYRVITISKDESRLIPFHSIPRVEANYVVGSFTIRQKPTLDNVTHWWSPLDFIFPEYVEKTILFAPALVSAALIDTPLNVNQQTLAANTRSRIARIASFPAHNETALDLIAGSEFVAMAVGKEQLNGMRPQLHDFLLKNPVSLRDSVRLGPARSLWRLRFTQLVTDHPKLDCPLLNQLLQNPLLQMSFCAALVLGIFAGLTSDMFHVMPLSRLIGMILRLTVAGSRSVLRRTCLLLIQSFWRGSGLSSLSGSATTLRQLMSRPLSIGLPILRIVKIGAMSLIECIKLCEMASHPAN